MSPWRGEVRAGQQGCKLCVMFCTGWAQPLTASRAKSTNASPSQDFEAFHTTLQPAYAKPNPMVWWEIHTLNCSIISNSISRTSSFERPGNRRRMRSHWSDLPLTWFQLFLGTCRVDGLQDAIQCRQSMTRGMNIAARDVNHCRHIFCIALNMKWTCCMVWLNAPSPEWLLKGIIRRHSGAWL